MREPFVFRKVNDNFYVIAEMHDVFPAHEKSNPPHTCTLGLVIGQRKAALIDTGTGMGDIAQFVSQFTDLPIIVLNTHGHLDHVGANSLFEKRFLSKKDEPLLAQNKKEDRLGFLKSLYEKSPDMIEYAEKNIVGDATFDYSFIEDGDIVDLGGVQLETLAFPGHTKGSLVFIDRRDQVVFGGDSILFRVLLNIESDALVTDYVKAMDNFLKKTEGIDEIIPGHQWASLHKSDAYELRECAMDIINGAPGNPINFLHRDCRIHEHGKKRICFNPC